MHHDVRPELERAEQYRSGDRIIDQQRNAMPMSDFRQGFQIADVSGGISDALTEYRPGIVVDQFFDCRGIVGLGEPGPHPELRQNMCEKRVSGSVKLRYG